MTLRDAAAASLTLPLATTGCASTAQRLADLTQRLLVIGMAIEKVLGRTLPPRR
jgi:hypothetical protein